MLFIFISFSLCWGSAGHKIIARIAQLEITSEQNQWITDLFSLWPEESGDLISLSSWQDTIIGSNLQIKTMKTWHYSDEPYILNSFSEVEVPPISYNVTDICSQAISFLLNKSTTSPWSLSFGFRSLIHFIGDSHQPMHSVSLFCSEFKNGDFGGNAYSFKSQYGPNAAQLHKVWDYAGLLYQSSWPSEAFELNVTKLIDSHPKSLYNDLILDENPYHWILESFNVAKNVAYTAKNNEKLDDEYLKKVQDASNERIALAGYRLGHFLNKFFKIRGLPRLYAPFETSIENKVKKSEIFAWSVDALCVLYLLVDKIIFKNSKNSSRKKDKILTDKIKKTKSMK